MIARVSLAISGCAAGVAEKLLERDKIERLKSRQSESVRDIRMSSVTDPVSLCILSTIPR